MEVGKGPRLARHSYNEITTRRKPGYMARSARLSQTVRGEFSQEGDLVMVFVYLKNGDCVEIEDAESALRVASMLLCFDRNSEVIRSFDIDDVQLFTANPETADIVKEEECDGESSEDLGATSLS
jgi:hypothetical protein